MTSDWIALATIRLVYLLSGAGLFGMSLFQIYAPVDVRRFCASDKAIGKVITTLALAAFFSIIAWAIATLGRMTGDGLAVAFDARSWHAFATETTFGQAWMFGVALALSSVLLAAYATNSGRFWLLAAASALMLVNQAWLGHAGAIEGPLAWAVKLAYAFHVLGAGTWFGGLLSLAVVLGSRAERFDTTRLLERFSGVGLLAVVAIIAGGCVNAIAHLSSAGATLSSTWGRTLVVKVALVLLMLALACLNRFFLMSPLRLGGTSGRRRLQQSVFFETALGVAVLAVTAVLGILSPAS